MDNNRNPSFADVWEFNPDQMSERDFMSTLVARDQLIEKICNWLRRHKGLLPEKHLLYHGPRGIGKTTLILAIYYTIISDVIENQQKDLRRSFLPIRFPETSNEMPDEPSFVLLTHELLEKNRTRLGISSEFDRFKFEPTLDSLIEFSRKLNRQFVFFIESMHDFPKAILEGRGGRKSAHPGKNFLDKLTGSKEFLLVTTSLSEPPRSTKSKSHSFWQKFESDKLLGLPTEKDAGLLLEKRAECETESDYIKQFRKNFSRVRGVFALSHGNPRYLVILYKMLREDSFKGIQTDFKRIMDGLTPVFDAELNIQIPASKKPVLRALIKAGGRGDKKQVAQQLSLPGTEPDAAHNKKVLNTLSELATTDFVETDEAVKGRIKFYQATPPLFQLWYEMRILGRSVHAILLELYSYIKPKEEKWLDIFNKLMAELDHKPGKDTNKLLIDLLISEAENYGVSFASSQSPSDFENSINSGIQAALLSEESGDKLNEARALGISAQAHNLKGNFKKSIELGERAIALSQSINETHIEALISRIVADSCGKIEEFSKGIKFGIKAVELSNESNNIQEEAVALGVVLGLSRPLNDLAKIIKYGKRAIRLAQELENKVGELFVLKLVADASRLSSDFEAAINYSERAIRIAQELNDKESEAVALSILAEALRMVGKFENTIKYGKKAIILYQEMDVKSREVIMQLTVAEALRMIKCFEESIEYGERAIKLSRELMNRVVEVRGLEAVAEALRMSGNYDKAIKYSIGAFQILQDFDNKEMLLLTLRTITLSLWSTKDISQTINYGEKLIALAGELGNAEYEASGKTAVASALLEKGEQGKALEYAESAISLVKEITPQTALNAYMVTMQINVNRKKFTQVIDICYIMENVAKHAGLTKDVEIANLNLFIAHLARSLEYTLSGKLEKAKVDIEAMGDYLPFTSDDEEELKKPYRISIREFFKLVHENLFFVLIKKELFAETLELMKVTRRWETDYFNEYYDIIEAVVPYFAKGDDENFKNLNPIPRAVAYELSRQIKDKQTIDKVNELLEEGLDDEALEQIKEIISESPYDINALRKGLSIAINKDLKLAEEYARKAIELSEDDPADFGNLGLLLLRKGEKNAAVEYLIKAIDNGSKDIMHFRALAAYYDEKNDFHMTISVNKEALGLQLDDGTISDINLELLEYSILLGEYDESENYFETINAKNLPIDRFSVYLYLLYVNSHFTSEKDNIEVILTEFCDHLLDKGKEIISTWNFSNLVRYTEEHCDDGQAKLLRRWAKVIKGEMSFGEFIQLYGNKEQRNRSASETEDERELALYRLKSHEIESIVDIERLSTRENAVEIALAIYTDRYADLAQPLRVVSRKLVLEGLSDNRQPVMKTAMSTAGGLFWKFTDKERKQCLNGILSIASNENLGNDLRNSAIKILGSLYFHLEKDEKKEVFESLKKISEKFKTRHLTDLIELITK
ncbi:MAG: hypothetical protein HN356_01405 [Calditrichaeota bacterium]|nr:hypothetical protein [Calditrichota bacterium]MBT7616150.1 hypothetical protein [Calditrichota bacterium]